MHVAAVTDGTANGAAIYFNGVAQSLNGGDATLNGPTSVSRGFSRIGNVTSNEFNGSWPGEMSDIRLWSTARTATEVADNYNKTLTGTHTGLVSNWHLDEIVSGTTVIDTTGTSNGTISSAPTIVDTAPDVFGTAMSISADEAAIGEMTAADVTGTATYSVSGGTVTSGVSTKATTNGSVSIDQTSGAWVYTPNATFEGTETFILTATGATSGTDNETISITVTDPGPASNNVHGGALQLNGTNSTGGDYISVPDSNSLDLASAFTIETWINMNSVASRVRILNKGNAYAFAVEAGGKLLFASVDAALASDVFITTNAHVSVGEWTHVAVVFDAAQDANFYVNGVLVQTIAGTRAAQSTTTVMDIGRLARISQTHLGGVSSGADEPGCGSICVALRQSGPGLIV